MTDQNATLIQQNARPKLQGRTLSNWTLSDRIILVITLAVAGLALWQLDPLVGFFCLTPLAMLFRSSQSYGRLYVDLLTEFASIWRNDFHKGVWWRAVDDEGSKLARWLRRRHSALPAQHVRIQAEIDGVVERFCLLHQTDRPYDHFYIVARGGAFASADVNQQTRLVGEMNDALNQIISQSGLKAGISHLRISAPFNQMTVSNNFREGMDPIIAYPELFELDEQTSDWAKWARKNTQQIPVALESYRGAEIWSLIVITIKRRRKWKNLKLTNDEIAETPIIELGHALIESLRDNGNLKLQEVHSPSLPESALISRSSWDIVRLNEYYRMRDNGEIPTTDEQIDAILDAYMAAAEAEAAGIKSKRKRKKLLAAGVTEGAREVDRLLQAWPQERIETSGKDNYLRFDDNYIAILRVTELPTQFRSDQIMSLHWAAKGRWTRFAFVSESTSGDSESTMLVYQASALENFNRAFFGHRIVRDPRRTKKSRDVLDQLEQMSVNTVAQMANGLITVIERDPKKLRRAIKEVKARYKSIGFKTQQVTGSARLIDYYFSGALAANRA